MEDCIFPCSQLFNKQQTQVNSIQSDSPFSSYIKDLGLFGLSVDSLILPQHIQTALFTGTVVARRRKTPLCFRNLFLYNSILDESHLTITCGSYELLFPRQMVKTNVSYRLVSHLSGVCGGCLSRH